MSSSAVSVAGLVGAAPCCSPPPCRSRTATGVKVSLRALTTPWAPTVRMPQVSLRQSIVRAPPSRSKASKTAPGTVIVADQPPPAVIEPPLAEDAVSDPGNATKRWKPWLSRPSPSGT